VYGAFTPNLYDVFESFCQGCVSISHPFENWTLGTRGGKENDFNSEVTFAVSVQTYRAIEY